MNPSRVLRSVFISIAFNALASNAHAFFNDDEARKAILDLRQKVDVHQMRNLEELKKANDDNAQLRRSILDLSNQLEVMRAEIAKMRGQDEQLARDVADVQRQQKDIVQGVDERIRKLEPSKVTVDGNEFIAIPSEMRDFDAALATLRKADFATAQMSFLEFIRRYPQSGYGPSALFWLGNSQYALRAYREAIVNFNSLLAMAPDHLRSPEAALSIANCQVELKDTLAARKTLTDLVTVYPKSEAAAVAKDRLTKLK